MGLVQPAGSTSTGVTVTGVDAGQMGALSFGVAELSKDFEDSRELLVRNHSNFAATFTVAVKKVSGVPHTVTVSSSTITVRGKDTADLRVKMEVPADTVGGTHDAQQNALYEEAAGYVTLTPVDNFSNGGVALRLPYYLVPRARSNVGAVLKNGKQLAVHVDNRNGVIGGNADFYVWGLRNAKTNTLQSGFEPRAVGVQSNIVPGADPSTNDSVLVFAINTHGRVSNFGAGEYDILIDVNGVLSSCDTLLTKSVFCCAMRTWWRTSVAISHPPNSMKPISAKTMEPSVNCSVEADLRSCCVSKRYRAASQCGRPSPISVATKGCFQSPRNPGRESATGLPRSSKIARQ